MTPFITTTYNKFQDFLAPQGVNLPPFKTIAEKAVKIHGEFKAHVYKYLSPKSADLCTKLLHAIPITLVLNILSTPQLLVVSAIGGACLWSCKKEFLPKDSKISLLHSMAIVFFSNIITYSTELSLGILFRLPVNAALLVGSLFMADQLETQVKSETKKPQPEKADEQIELPSVEQVTKAVSDIQTIAKSMKV